MLDKVAYAILRSAGVPCLFCQYGCSMFDRVEDDNLVTLYEWVHYFYYYF